MNINIKIDEDQLAGIVVSDLEDTLNYFNCMLTKERPNIFHTDPITDKVLIMKRIEAFETVLAWYK